MSTPRQRARVTTIRRAIRRDALDAVPYRTLNAACSIHCIGLYDDLLTEPEFHLVCDSIRRQDPGGWGTK